MDVHEAADRLPARALPAEAALVVEAVHRENGVTLHLGSRPDPASLEADLVVAAIGIVPADGLAREAGPRVDNGKVVDPDQHAGQTGLRGSSRYVAIGRDLGLVRFPEWLCWRAFVPSTARPCDALCVSGGKSKGIWRARRGDPYGGPRPRQAVRRDTERSALGGAGGPSEWGRSRPIRMSVFPAGGRPGYADAVATAFAGMSLSYRATALAENAISALAQVSAGHAGAIVPASVAAMRCPTLAFTPISDGPMDAPILLAIAATPPAPVLWRFLEVVRSVPLAAA